MRFQSVYGNGTHSEGAYEGSGGELSTLQPAADLTSQLAQYDLMDDTNMEQLNMQIEKER